MAIFPIDHTLLKPDSTRQQIQALCKEAVEYSFGAVCVNPSWVKECVNNLHDTAVKVCTVVGFPLGATTPQVKAFEAKQALESGANELDMVMNIGAAKDGDWGAVQSDIEAVVQVARQFDAITVKVILETCLLTDEEIKLACKTVVAAGADFVKTSTGFSTGGATTADVALMREAVGPDFGVKASGGIHSNEEMEAMLKAGANRIGASAGKKLLERGAN
ncbi:deoxyribose-phosphate aldolase [Gleimia hominis]|uniref:deoxyribose-phosphate aldolase n=1 Tax=Gleimia hominis TaxID=595468 RepID=UPI000C7FCD31|nr:deoxyribose-phosphate aldolase [Gleimia hominis]WIK63918.1 deoxyribose-phosphate aldolase [Gleimia hominis]